jgi:hypothetical protein
LVGFLDLPLDLVLFFYDADEADYLPANAIAAATPAKEICRRGDHRRGIRRTADQTPAGCEYEIGISTWRCQDFVWTSPQIDDRHLIHSQLAGREYGSGAIVPLGCRSRFPWLTLSSSDYRKTAPARCAECAVSPIAEDSRTAQEARRARRQPRTLCGNSVMPWMKRGFCGEKSGASDSTSMWITWAPPRQTAAWVPLSRREKRKDQCEPTARTRFLPSNPLILWSIRSGG